MLLNKSEDVVDGYYDLYVLVLTQKSKLTTTAAVPVSIFRKPLERVTFDILVELNADPATF